MNSETAKSRIGEVIRIDTVTSTQADFLATHVPVQNIHIRKKWIVNRTKSCLRRRCSISMY